MEHYLRQNNAVNIYGEYFTKMDIIYRTEPEALKIANVFRCSCKFVVSAFTDHDIAYNYKRTRCWALDRVHNSRRLLYRLFALCDPVTLTF